MTWLMSAAGYEGCPPITDAAAMDAHSTPRTPDARLFERLCLLRALYERRGDQDRIAEMSVEEAIGYAEARLEAAGVSEPSDSRS